MNYTQKYQLCQWEETDRILRTDFNADNAKLEAALAARPCQFYTSSYVGAGAKSRTLAFPKKPMFVVVMGSACCFFTVYEAGDVCAVKGSGRDNQMLNCTWSGYAFTWNGDNDLYLDFPLHNYLVLALLDTDT